MAININADTTTGLQLESDTSGNINIQNDGTTVVAVTSSGAAVTGTLSATGGFSFDGANISTQPSFRNRIINGDMRIDQRNAGASITVTTGNVYGADRFNSSKSTSSGTMTVQQSTTAPTGFKNSLLHTVSTGASPAAGDQNRVEHCVEGYNFADLDFGTANAKTFTFSFWVRSSVTGTYAVAFLNAAWNRSYVATYTISSANTWEQKTITITGDTTGTWATDNTVGIRFKFDLGSGSTSNTATPNQWVSGEYYRTSSTVTLLSTTGATFYITGVQLEVGDTATPFEHRPYDVELLRCMRYYENTYATGTAVGTNIGNDSQSKQAFAVISSSKAWSAGALYKVQKRASPTVTIYNRNGTSGQWYWGSYGVNEATSATVIAGSTQNELQQLYTTSYPAGTNGAYGHYTADAEL